MNQHDSTVTGPVVGIQLLPLEEDDLETITAVGSVEDALRREIETIDHYRLANSISENENKTRGGSEIFQLVPTLLQAIHDQPDIVKILIGAGIPTLTLLLKHRRVKKLEVKLGKKTLRIEQADQSAAERYLQQFEDMCREEETMLSPQSKLEITAHVSKKSTPSHKGLSKKKD